MKERPILMSAPMVRAILDGRKTQTRRIMKKPPDYPGTTKFAFEKHPFAPSGFVGTPAEGLKVAPESKVWVYEDWCGNIVGVYGDCKYGMPCDQLWVKETSSPDFKKFLYRADGEFSAEGYSFPFKWRPSIFMRREWSRIQLEITLVRVERLNDISEEDAEAEGSSQKIWIKSPFSAGALNATSRRGTFREGYKDLWESINGVGSWALNPWVWVVTFRRITQ